MHPLPRFFIASLAVFPWLTPDTIAKARVEVGYNREGAENFEIPGIPLPRREDAGATATFTVIDGEGAFGDKKVRALNDGALPAMDDDPTENFFFANRDNRRLLIDLGRPVSVREFNTYSWHPGARGPQVYRLYASDGSSPDFNPKPKAPLDPTKGGWQLIADVDTRSKAGGRGGQYGVSVTDPAGQLGAYRYFLMLVSPADPNDPESDTFFSEVDVVDRAAPVSAEPAMRNPSFDNYETSDKKTRFTILYGDAPDLKEWTRTKLAPVVRQWYPKIAELLKSPGFSAPSRFTIKFTNDYDGVAVTMGTHIEGDPKWYRTSLDTEAVGSMVHELVHVVQQYGLGRRQGGKPTPTWVSEGIADYVRWELYEPKPRFRVDADNVTKIRYDQSYQTTADFLKWVAVKYDRQLIPKLNQVAREGRYDESFWKKVTGRTAGQLDEEWRRQYAKKLGVKLGPVTGG